MKKAQPFATILRFGSVAVSREILEERLGVQLDRFELQHSGTLHIAQINFPNDRFPGEEITEVLSKIGSSILLLVAEGAIASPSLDMAFEFKPTSFTHSVSIPSAIAHVAGRYGVDVEVACYHSADDEARQISL